MTPPDRASLMRRLWPDLSLGALGLAFGWASVTYPFGRDQGLYYYVAREWVLRGSIPYRDVFDHKTPGIYVIHALAIALFGEKMWGIRVLDLVCIALMGIIAATFSAAPRAPVMRGMRGGCVLVASVLFYGFLNFWDTAQSEIWYATFGLASIWAARRIENQQRAEAIAGLLGAIAMILKPPAAWFVGAAFVICILHIWGSRDDRWRRVAMTTARFGAGFAIPIAIMLGYFGAHHALGAMRDIVVGANGYYVSHESSIHDLEDVTNATLFYYRFYSPVSVTLFGGLLVATVVFHRRKDLESRNRHIFAFVLCALGYFAVAMQKKFYLLHWSVVIAPATAVAAIVIADIELFTRDVPRRIWIRLAGVGLAVAMWVDSDWGYRTWVDQNRAAVEWLSGKIDREEFTNRFSIPVLGFWYHDSEAVGLWLKQHTTPEETVAVRGFDSEIYVSAERHYGGRFFWTTFLTSPVRAYKREEWLAEDAAVFAAHPPRYVVTLSDIHDGLDAAETYLPKGYAVVTQVKEFTILERTR